MPTFPLGYFWHLSIFADRYHQLAMYRDEVIIPWPRLDGRAGADLCLDLSAPVRRPRLANRRLRFGLVFGLLALVIVVLPVAAKYRMSSVSDFVWLETAFTVLQYLIVSPLIAWASSVRLAAQRSRHSLIPARSQCPTTSNLPSACAQRCPAGRTSSKKMFGGYCWILNGNMFCGVEVGRFMFRVGKEREAKALERAGASPMDITGRPMAGFLWVSARHADGAALRSWIGLAEEYVGQLPPK